MKFNEQWLREWVDPTMNTQQLAHQLTMAGLEVDAITPVAAEFIQVVVGRVLSVEPHPDADRLRVCQVSVGQDKEALTIVCGASNVAEGVSVPTALVGAVLPGGMKIKKSKLRGVQSFGMLCSAVELGLAEQADGLMILPADAEVGLDIRDYLKLDDVSIEIGLTPNRGDCLSIAGVAREVAVLNELELSEPVAEPVAVAIQDAVGVSSAVSVACPLYLGRVVRGLDMSAQTPLWLAERLRRCGLRSVNPVVDVTNYVMLELGQPMHAFDLAKLSGDITVRMAVTGEPLTLIGGEEVVLQDDTLVIADKQGPVAMAGIMGGESTAVDSESCDVFLESAFFNPDAISGRARQYGLHTDSSHRFERGVDFELPAKAMNRASELLVDLFGASVGPVSEISYPDQWPERQGILLRAERVSQLLGVDISLSQMVSILTRLGMGVKAEREGRWFITPPSFRFDIAIEADLIEELGRIYGYDNIPTTRPIAALGAEQRKEAVLAPARIRQLLVDRGYQEAITYSFVDPKVQTMLLPDVASVALLNPLSAELSVMRTSLWPGLVQTLIYNQNRQQTRVRLFEVGVKFSGQPDQIKEGKVLAGLVSGHISPVQWGEEARAVDYYDVKADVEALLAMLGCEGGFSYAAAKHSALHPGQTAAISYAGHQVGWLGALHPSMAKSLGISGDVFMFEIAYSVLEKAVLPRFAALSKFPALKRDLALVVDEGVEASQVQQLIVDAGGEYLTNVALFDVYRGEGVACGRKSLALGLTFQGTTRTLTDQEVESLTSEILARLSQELKATLRE